MGIYRSIIVCSLVILATACFAQGEPVYGMRWEFEEGEGAWRGTHMGVEAADGVLQATIEGRDPWITSPEMAVEAARYPFIQVRLRTADPHIARGAFYWRTDASPHWTEPVRHFEFPLMPDGEWHTYDLRVGSRDWKDKIIQLRFDSEPSHVGEGSAVEIDFIRIYGMAWEGSLSLGRQRLAVGDTAELMANVRALNATVSSLQHHVAVPPGLELIAGQATTEAGNLAEGAEATTQWGIAARREGVFRIGWRGEAEGLAPLQMTREVFVTAADPALPAQPARAAEATRIDGEHIILQSDRVRLAFVKSGEGYVHALIDVWDDGWRRMGSAYPLGEAVRRTPDGQEESLLLVPEAATVERDGGQAQVTLTGTVADTGDAPWRYELRAQLGEKSGDVRLTARVECGEGRKLLRFAGPMLHAGDGSFGGRKDEAMLPGLEWLVGDERSSSTLDIAPPQNVRYVPHPYKVTVPAMCVAHEGRVVGLAWDPLQKWDGEHICPLAQFCSPNWINEADDHLMGLFVPSMPGWVIENQTLAKEPYDLPAGRELTLRSALVTGADTTCLQTVWRYFDLFGELTAQPVPMTDAEAMALADETYLERLWKAPEKSWIYCFPFSRSKGQALPASNGYYSRFALALLTDSVLRADPAAKQAVRAQLKTSLDAAREGSGHWYLQPDLAFRWDWLKEALLGEEHAIKGIIESQRDDGSWGGFKPTAKTESLGEAGQREVGLCGKTAHQLLKYARVTRNRRALEAGLKAMEFMERFEVPRAAQTWECPVHSPDIYASYAAIMPHLEAYRITGERKYLERAVYWAETGLPFVYVWGAPDRPVMQGGSIAIFGASFFTGNWIGRPVQWNGMEYSWALLKLAEYDDSRPWRELATSIMRSGMWQQEKDDSADAKGGYTDNWDLPSDERCTSFILSPWWIVLNLHTLRGFDPDLQTDIVQTPGGAIHVTSGAKVAASMDGGDLRVDLTYAPGETVHCLAAGVSEPQSVLQGERELRRREDLGEVGEGWAYLPERALLFVKVRLGMEVSTRLRVTGVEAREADWEIGSVARPPYKSARQMAYEEMPFEAAADWDFAREEERKWQELPRSDMSEPRIIDGVLTASATGPDPRISLPIEHVEAGKYPVVTVEMSVDRGTQFEVYFATDTDPEFSESKSIHTQVAADGEFHKYVADLSGQPYWQGTVTALRFDPVGPVNEKHVGATIRVKRIAVSNKPF